MRWDTAALFQLEQATRRVLADGHRLFHTHRLDPDDRVQVRHILDLLDPPPGAVILDAGCGVGEVARLMAETRPDLRFILANVSRMQLNLCPRGKGFMHLHGDCHHLPELAAESVDAVMFNSALTQMDAGRALAEAARVLVPGGVVQLFEMVCEEGADTRTFELVSNARVRPISELAQFAAAAGLRPDVCEIPDTDDSYMRRMLGENQDLIAPIRAVLLRFIKG